MKAKTRDSTLPRRRSAPALALQSPRHRQRVIPDKRRAKLDHELKETARKFGPAMRALANKAECCEWQTGQRKGPCREVHCDDCPLWRDGEWLGEKNKRTMNEETRAVALGLEPLGIEVDDDVGC